jgi:RNA polymerase sigma-70 factor (ECF subfamily)
MESIDIKTIVEKAEAQEAGAFTVLYEHLVDRVFPFVAARMNDRMTAKEVTQDIFVELNRSLAKFTYQSDPAFYAFVFTIARRQLAAKYKENKKHLAPEVDESILAGDLPSVEVVHSVESALDTLDECSREIIVLHHWSRFTFAEIGTLINMTEGAVRVRHHRAKTMLASLLRA